MIGQNGKKMMFSTAKSRSALCSAILVGLILQLTTQQDIYLLIRLSPSVQAFQRFTLAAVSFFRAATTRDTALPLPKTRG